MGTSYTKGSLAKSVYNRGSACHTRENHILERDGVIEEGGVQQPPTIVDYGEGVSGSNYGWAIENPDANADTGGQKVYERRYVWDDTETC